MNNNQSDIEYFIKEFNYLITSYNISINEEFRFIYDEFLDHLILDSQKRAATSTQKKQIIFRSCFYLHFKSREWYDKIMKPHKCPEIIRRLRINKLEKIKENYGN